MRMVRDWLPEEAVDDPLLEGFNVRFGRALSKLT